MRNEKVESINKTLGAGALDTDMRVNTHYSHIHP